MSQKFFETTIISKFIKYLLSYTPLPICPTISANDIMIEGCTYIYKDKVLRCTSSGKFIGINGDKYIEDYLYVNEDLYVTDDSDSVYKWSEEDRDFTIPAYLTVTEDVVRYVHRNIAKFNVIGNYSFGVSYPNITQTFTSNVSYYDSKTHRFLGDYLRCLRDIYGINLMGMYNCFDNELTTKFYLDTNSNRNIIERESSEFNVFLIPIKFNKVYTIATDCSFPVYAQSVLYNNRLLYKNEIDLSSSFVKYPNIQFNKPATYKVTTQTANFMDKEKYLYLALQIPKTNTSSIVVLEGNYTSIADRYISDIQGIEKLSDDKLSKIFSTKLSLLKESTKEPVPFSDKLISYLLRNVIDSREYIDDNVANVETKIGYYPNIKNFYKGMWDNGLRYALYKGFMELDNIQFEEKLDILGYVDRDIEDAVNKGLIHYGE